MPRRNATLDIATATPEQLDRLAARAAAKDPDRARHLHLLALVRRNRGNLSAMARELTAAAGGKAITRQGVTLRLRAFGLEAEADMLRALGDICGPRKSLVAGRPDAAGEADQIVQALATSENAEQAAAKLGIPRRTLFRRKAALGITADQVAAARPPAP